MPYKDKQKKKEWAQNYPNVEFKFKGGDLKGTYHGHTDGKSCYLSTDKP